MTHTIQMPLKDSWTLRHDAYSKTVLGFWIYLMTDCVLFSTLFATYAVLHNHTYGGPTSAEVFNLPYALGETMILLSSSFLSGMMMLAAQRNKRNLVLGLLALTFLLGASFLAMELNEFTGMILKGQSWTQSAFLSSFFTLVGTHGLHITFGLVWMTTLAGQILSLGINSNVFRRLVCFSMFWHFLDVVWIFIFTFAYLMGAK